MKKIRSYISILTCLVLLFPIVERTAHDLGHLADEHCGIKTVHYCQAEHSCSICEYLFSSSLIPPHINDRIHLFYSVKDRFHLSDYFNTRISSKFNFSLRGPPATV